MTDQERKWWYAWLFFFAFSTIIFSILLIGSLVDNYQFDKYGSLIRGQIAKVTPRGTDGFDYLIRYKVDDTAYSDQLHSFQKIGDVSDSASIYYLRNTREIGLLSELNDWGFNPTLLIFLICFVSLFFLVFKKPDLITRFKGELDNQG